MLILSPVGGGGIGVGVANGVGVGLGVGATTTQLTSFDGTELPDVLFAVT
jgi:hypothetical protein